MHIAVLGIVATSVRVRTRPATKKKKKKKNLIVCDNKNGTIKKPRKNVKLYSLIRGNFEISVFEILRAVRRIYFFR